MVEIIEWIAIAVFIIIIFFVFAVYDSFCIPL